MIVTYLEHGPVHDFKRTDTTRKVKIYRPWTVGGLLYGYRDQFNIICISKEDIISIEEA